EIFPDARLGIGPPIDTGFYYDFELPRTLTTEDLPVVEEKMRTRIKSDVPFESSLITKDEERERCQDQPYKLELNEQIRQAQGGRVRTVIEDFWREEHLRGGYDIVYSPHIGKSTLWETSGHLDFYSENMYSPMDIDGQDYYVKPMNCPFHIQMYKNSLRSY